MIRNFINALQFLTIFTVSRKHAIAEGDMAKSMLYFPLVGLLIGVVLSYSDQALTWIPLPPTIANAILLLISVLITRALHIDGLADTLDGMMGGHDKESRLRIMKDSRLGTAGALGIIFVLLIKYLSFNSLFSADKSMALLSAPMLARWSQALMVFKANYGREDGLGSAFVGHLRRSGLVAVTAVTVGLAAFIIVHSESPRDEFLSAVLALGAVIGVALLTFVSRWYLVRKIGGVTGDTIGAVSELNEIFVFLLFVLMSNGG